MKARAKETTKVREKRVWRPKIALKMRDWEREMAQASRCMKCKKKLTAEPPPVAKGRPRGPKTKQTWRHMSRVRFARVSIRCAYCFYVYCLKCAMQHFTPTHHMLTMGDVKVKKREMYVLVAPNAAKGGAQEVLSAAPDAKMAARMASAVNARLGRDRLRHSP